MANDGFDDLQKFLQQAEQGAKELQGNHEYAVDEILTDSFISNQTRFSSLDGWWEAGNFGTDSMDEVEDKALDTYVDQSTSFSTFDDMIEEAVSQFTAKKLGFDN